MWIGPPVRSADSTARIKAELHIGSLALGCQPIEQGEETVNIMDERALSVIGSEPSEAGMGIEDR
jgi:hypothetical protein